MAIIIITYQQQNVSNVNNHHHLHINNYHNPFYDNNVEEVANVDNNISLATAKTILSAIINYTTTAAVHAVVSAATGVNSQTSLPISTTTTVVTTLSSPVTSSASSSSVTVTTTESTENDIQNDLPQIPAYIRTTSMVFCITIMLLGVIGNIMVSYT